MGCPGTPPSQHLHPAVKPKGGSGKECKLLWFMFCSAFSRHQLLEQIQFGVTPNWPGLIFDVKGKAREGKFGVGRG